MHKRIIMLIICLALLMIAAAAYAEDAAGISSKLDVAYVSKYVWRGVVPDPDPSLQPSLTFAHPCGASLNVWASADLTDANSDKNHVTEIDYTLDYAKKLPVGTLNGGIVYYSFPNTEFRSTSEVYAAYCLDGKVTTTLSANYDFDEADGMYAAITAGYACTSPWQKETAPSLNFSAKVGYATGSYNDFYFGEDKSAFTDLLLSASVPLKMGSNLNLTPSISYSKVLDSALRDSVKDPDNFWVGLTASTSF